LARSIWLPRLCIAAVLLFNIQCALAFLLWPHRYAPAYELDGAVGVAVVRSFGVLFVMWNVPYAVALWHPWRHRLALWESVVMQGIGVFGETAILWALPAEHAILRGSIERFILFDGVGLGLLLIAAALVTKSQPSLLGRT
jgi:hypothetical protein